MTKLFLSKIRLDGGTQPRSERNQQLIADYANDMREGAKFPAVIVFHDGECYWLVDGFHRVAAAKEINAKQIEADVRQGTLQEAQWASFGVNAIHGLRRSNEDKRRAVIAALKHPNGASKSNGEIARHCGVDESTVRVHRAQLEATSGIPKSDQRVGADGRTINTENIGAAPKFHVGQRVRYQGLIYDITAMTSGLKYNLRSALLNGKPETDVPEGEIQPFGAAPEPPTNPPPSPRLFTEKDFSEGDFVLTNVKGFVLELYRADERSFVDMLHARDSDGRTFTLLANAVTPIDLSEGTPKPRLTAGQLLEIKKFTNRDLIPFHSQADPTAALMLKAGDTVRTRTGHIGKLVERAGGLHVETSYGVQVHPLNTLTKIAPLPVADDQSTAEELALDEQLAGQVLPEEPQPPVPVTKRDWDEETGAVGEPTSRSGKMRAALEALGCQVYHVTAHHDGSYRIEFEGDQKYSVEEAIERAREIGTELLDRGYAVREMSYWNGGTPMIVLQNDKVADSDEWYTPEEVIEVVRTFLVEIDLDPASCAEAQKIVRAAVYYDRKQDGLLQIWHGRTWLNAPYSYPLVEQFTGRLIEEVAAGRVAEAVTVVNNSTATQWFQRLLQCADMVCFPEARINFYHPRKGNPGNRTGQAFFYFGLRSLEFIRAFEPFGAVLPCAALRPEAAS